MFPKKLQGLLFCYSFVPIFAISLFISASTFAQTESGPNFCGVDDIMEGQRTIMSLDNLVLSNVALNPSVSANYSQYFFDMDFNQVDSTSSQNVFTNTNCGDLPTDGAPLPFQQKFARLFDTTNDFLVTVRMGASKGCSLALVVRAEDAVNNTNITLNTTSSQNWIQTAVGDFNVDGYDDIFIITNFEIIIVTASDPENPSSGLVTAFRGTLSSIGLEGFAAMNEPSISDINKDLNLEVALVGGGTENGSQLSAYILTVCNGVGQVGDCGGTDAFTPLSPIFITDLEATVNPGATLYSRFPAVAITAGTFGGTGGVVIVDSSSSRFMTELWQFSSDLSPIGPVLSNQTQSLNTNSVLARSGKVSWFGGSEQVILAFSGSTIGNSGGPFVELQVIDVTSFLNSVDWVINTDFINITDDLTLTGIDVGTFTEEIVVVNDDVPVSEFNLKLALSLTSQNSSTRSILRVYEFPFSSSNDFEFFLTEQFTFSSLMTTLQTVRGGSMLQSGDSEGLGFLLGEPFIVRASQTQTSNIIQAPPRHSDYVNTGRVENGNQLLNISANLSNYLASYNVVEEEAISSTTQSTTSYTQVTSEEVGLEFAYRAIEPTSNKQLWGAGGSVDLLWRQTDSETIAENFNQYSGVTNSLTVLDVEADYIQFTEKIMSYYIYPFIGYKACSEGSPNCSEDEMNTVNYAITGPSNTVITVSNGRVNEFYQPAHEPVNILSYPTTESQLRRQFNFTTPLTQVKFDLTGNVTESIAEWVSGSTDTKTVETTNIDDFNRTFNVWAEVGDVQKASGVRLSTTVKWNVSNALGRVNSNTYSQQSSQGLRIKLPGTFADAALYGYSATAYVFTEDTGEIQQPIERGSDDPLQNLNGRLQTAFSVEPQTASNSLGSWWTGNSNWYNQYPDIALNRPASKFLYVLNNAPVQEKPFFCLVANKKDTNKLNCSFIYSPDTFATLWESPWYFMRGMFINVGGEGGPQRTFADAGEEVSISFRVYNYSLYQYSQADLNNIKGKARLYAQEWDPHNGRNIPVPGVASELIEEFTFSPIPRSQDPSGQDNFLLLTTDKFKTGQRAGKSYIFWVIVWMERDLGNGEVELVEEVPYHGLMEVPGELSGIRQTEEIIEWLEVNACWIAGNAQIPCTINPETGEPLFTAMSSFTNNVAFYKLPFHIVGEQDVLEEDPCVEELSPDSRLEFRNAVLTPDMVMEGEHVRVTAEVHTAGWEPNLAENVSVHEGTMNEVGPAIEFEHLGLIRGDQHRLIDFHFIPEGCGEKVITLLNDRGLVSEAYAAMDLFVECRAPIGTGGNGSCALAAPGENPSGSILLFAALILLVPLRRLIKGRVHCSQNRETENE